MANAGTLTYVGDALGGLVQIGGALLRAKGPIKARATAVLGRSVGQRALFAILRAVAPTLSLRKPLITAYLNTGTVILTRAADVREMLDREGAFAVVYEPKMRRITGGANFFLGMQDGPDYRRDTGAMRLAAHGADIAAIVAPLFTQEAAAIVQAAPGRIDLPQALLRIVPARMVRRYFGLDTASEADLIEWASAMFWYLFIDLKGDPAIEARALGAAARCRDALDAAVARHAGQGDADDLIGRCIVLREAGVAGLAGTGIRDNLIGLVIGAIPTIARAAAQALDGLLDRPAALAQAQAAAREGDDAALAACVFEALRFDPINPVIYRRATSDCTIAAGTRRARAIRKGQMVLAANLSAMFDPAVVPDAATFRPGRPWDAYMLWGYGRHLCFGDAINRVAIPALLKPVLARAGLRRAEGAAGRIDTGDTPFPQHFTVTFAG